MKQYNYMVVNKSEEEKNVDTIVSKKLLANLDDFLKKDRPPNTRKNRSRRVKTMRQWHK
jgi:rRNA processing protein Gar1